MTLHVSLYDHVDLQRALGPKGIAFSPVETGRMSFALFCPHCGEVWGRVRRGEGWFSLVRPCLDHGDSVNVGGSFFQRYDWWPEFSRLEDFLRNFPGLLSHEFNVHLSWAEQQISQPGASVPQQLELEL